MACLTGHPSGTVLSLHVQPRSSRNHIVGLHGDSLKIKVTSPPVEGAANKSCFVYLAKLFNLPKSEITLIFGEKSRQKRFLLNGLSPQYVESIIHAVISES